MIAISTLNVHLLLLTASLLTATGVAYGATSQLDCILVESARIANTRLAQEQAFRYANHGHQIVRGPNRVLAIRRYQDDGTGPDAQLFMKVTLEIAYFPQNWREGEAITIPIIHSAYSEGASAWVEKGRYWWAKEQIERVQLRQTPRGFHLNVQTEIGKANFASKLFPRESRSVKLDFECPVRSVRINNLTPWLGSSKTSWQSFYRQN